MGMGFRSHLGGVALGALGFGIFMVQEFWEVSVKKGFASGESDDKHYIMIWGLYGAPCQTSG